MEYENGCQHQVLYARVRVEACCQLLTQPSRSGPDFLLAFVYPMLLLLLLLLLLLMLLSGVHGRLCPFAFAFFLAPYRKSQKRSTYVIPGASVRA